LALTVTSGESTNTLTLVVEKQDGGRFRSVLAAIKKTKHCRIRSHWLATNYIFCMSLPPVTNCDFCASVCDFFQKVILTSTCWCSVYFGQGCSCGLRSRVFRAGC